MQLSKKLMCVLLCAAFGTGMLFAGGGQQRQAPAGEWRPTKPIQLIVPWGAGGSTDLLTRVVAQELQKELGQRIIVSNQAGASGATGTKAAMDAPRDGYTWTAGAASGLALYQVNDLLNTNMKDEWEIFLSAADIGIISVHVDSPWQTFDQLLAAFRANPGQITVSTAGLTSSGTINIEKVRQFTGIDYRNVTYGGGSPAVTALVSGEVQVTSQLISEQIDMIRGGRLRPLAALFDRDLEIAGYGTIPSITRSVPNYSAGNNYFGIFIPKDVPREVITTLQRIWTEKLPHSEEIKKFTADRGTVFDPSSGTVAQDRAFRYYQPIAWLFFDGGNAPIRPDTVGIPRP